MSELLEAHRPPVVLLDLRISLVTQRWLHLFVLLAETRNHIALRYFKPKGVQYVESCKISEFQHSLRYSAYMADSSTTSGITTTSSGERHIPASVRADGSVRKEIRVRPGYKPPEDVAVYRNRTAATWKTHGRDGVPGADFVELGGGKKKPSKEPVLRVRKAATSTLKDKNNDSAAGVPQQTKESVEQEPLDPEAEKEKEARKLSKKLRQARDLEQKKDKGASLLPEQFEKVIRINELIRQLEKLGFSADGEKKPE